MLINLKPHISKPPFGSVQVDWGHPLAQGLSFLSILSIGEIPRAVNLVRQVGSTREGTAAPTMTPYGPGMTYPAAGDSNNFGAGGIPNRQGNFSVFFRGQALADGLSHIAGSSSGPNIDSFHWGTLTVSNTFNFTMAGVSDIGSGINATAGNFYDVGMAYTRLVQARFNIYNLTTGSLSQATIADAGTPISTTEASRLGNARGATAVAWGNPLLLTYVWTRLLTDAEFAWLHREPYAFLRPVPAIRYWSTPPAIAAVGSVVTPRSFALLGVGS